MFKEKIILQGFNNDKLVKEVCVLENTLIYDFEFDWRDMRSCFERSTTKGKENSFNALYKNKKFNKFRIKIEIYENETLINTYTKEINLTLRAKNFSKSEIVLKEFGINMNSGLAAMYQSYCDYTRLYNVINFKDFRRVI